jgi:formamidopyrimidine-DNA glycosylase
MRHGLPSNGSALSMPELPEVEATRRHLEPVLSGARVVRADVRRARMVRRQERPVDFADRIAGRRVVALDRIGKFMVAPLEGDLTWVTHLGMSGRIQIADSSEPEAPHTNVVVHLDGGAEVRFVDPRTFGFMVVYTPDEYVASPMGRLGRDALTDLPRTPRLVASLEGRSAPIKALLLDQGIVAGLGNIYADEILHRARVAPQRPGGSLDRDEVSAIRRAIRPVLEAGLAAGGTSLDDLAYLLPDGRAGDYMVRLHAYGRAGERCRRCGGTIASEVLRQRTTHWCPGCQR